MLKKMRLRVILAAMIAFFVFIASIAILVNVINYYIVTNRIDQTISYIFNYEERTPAGPGSETPSIGPFMALPDVESNYMMRFFIVRFGNDAKLISVSTDYVASVDKTDAIRYAEQALKRKVDQGYLKEYRYVKKTINDSVMIIFLNVNRELQYIKSLQNLTLAVSAGSLALVFVLVVLLSGRAIKPIANNIKQQKQFITDISHELKAPLTSLSTSVDVIALEHGNDEWTDNIKKQTGRMSKLISELVTLSRLDEEIPFPNKEHFSLSNAAWEIVEVYRTQAKTHDKNLTVDIQENVTLFGEKAAIQQMLSVLLDNAIRYSDPNGEIRFSITKKRSKAQVELFNTCQYEKPPDVNRWFDRFYRPDGSGTANLGGTGVGLAIAKAIVETHGGTIKANCPDGKSMTTRVIL